MYISQFLQLWCKFVEGVQKKRPKHDHFLRKVNLDFQLVQLVQLVFHTEYNNDRIEYSYKRNILVIIYLLVQEDISKKWKSDWL